MVDSFTPSMNNPMRICITLGTRPEAIKLAPVIQTFRKLAQFDTKVVLTGQHREMVAQVMSLFDLKADHNLDIMQPKQTLGEITRRSLEGLERLFVDLKPAMVISQGDTTTAFAAALAAFYQQIPVGHVEAGLRTDNILDPFPEEANRRLVSQIATLHFAPTQTSVANLKASGVTTGIHQTGNTVIDALLRVADQSPSCDIPGLDWSSHRVILSTVHRRENWGTPLVNIAQSFLQILEKFPDTALLLPLHRNPTVRDPLKAALDSHPRTFLVEPLDYAQLVGAMKRAYLLLTDSGGLQEEAPGLGKPVLVLRETTERPEAITAGTAKLVGTKPAQIVAATSELLASDTVYTAMAKAINPFGDGHASERIAQIVTNYLTT
ncbi:UDP-N-acetylglucosamine 2-epimerase [Synechococcus sp. PCC 7335]|uniref:non-hydrolyzing UDP-N-acetylglucosamine 2-epimerase n=1 Tax=Synechococcus sp. (strain ATCC 29403 / PCC 7335) TaxID=91464 RepID=UPI00017EE0B7|nr:UDP-N-acetylglucosamine 2-epimerase [Synechococcus sp. PCC 7335]